MYKIVTIPAFNEENSIKNMIKECTKYCDQVIVCDDGSSDDTFNIAKSSGASVIRHDKNRGKGAALKSLFNEAIKSQADVIVTIDGDGQFLPQEIPKIMKPILENKSDVVIGNRFNQNSEMPSYRKFGNKILDKMTSSAADLPFEDTQSGFRAYSRNAIESIKFSNDGFASDSEILIDASNKNLRISEEDIRVIYNTGGETSTKNPISHSAGVVSSLLELIALRRPLTYLGIPGIILIIIGIVFTIIALSMFNDTRYFSIPITLIAVGSLVIGVFLFVGSIVLYSINRVPKQNS